MGQVHRRGGWWRVTKQASAGDELLRWISEAGSGNWEDLRETCAFICEKHDVKRRPWSLANDLSALGHIDIDWATRRWSVAPPTLNLVPGLGLCVVLTGSRPYHVDQRFAEATNDLDVYPFEVAQSPGPAAKFAKCASVETAHRVAGSFGAELVIDPAASLVSCMRSVDEVPVDLAPEPSLEESLRFDPRSLAWQTVSEVTPGLYRIDLHGRPVHRRLDEHGYWSAIDLAAGEFLELRRRKDPVVKWMPGDRSGKHAPTLMVRAELALPVLAQRAATVSSGFLPRQHERWLHYLNVPRQTAATISERLLQEFAVEQGGG